MSYDDLGLKLAESKLHLDDFILVGRDEWNNVTEKLQYAIRRKLFNTLERMTRGCFHCNKNYSNAKTVSLSGLESHHVEDSKK